MSTAKRHLPTYNTALMTSAKSGSAGVSAAEFAAVERSLAGVKSALMAGFKKEPQGFFGIPDMVSEANLAEKAARAATKTGKTLIVLGIGGSDLGARAITSALTKPGKGMDVRYLSSGADPEELSALLASVDMKKCVLNVVSKSGDTVEPMSAFLVLRDRLIKRVGVKRYASHIVATTDSSRGVLHEIARREGYATLPVPEHVGGRFSALTPVGLFPAACAGIPVMRLLDGARAMRDAFVTQAASKNGALLFAGLHHDGYTKRDQRVTVLMPYAASLCEFSFWFRQLWAESLGKARSRGGKTVHHGFTPIAAMGPADQHSQIQLYNEGPTDKIVTFLEVRNFRAELKVPKAFADLPPTAMLAGKKLGEIMQAERAATARSLATHGRPSGTLSISEITPESVGGLMMFFMLATAATAELLDVNAYDQPGVEEGKLLIKEALSKPRRP